jgi:hypothetical protein
MLESVASGKRLPEKSLLVLGTAELVPRHRELQPANPEQAVPLRRNASLSTRCLAPRQNAILTDKRRRLSQTTLPSVIHTMMFWTPTRMVRNAI